MPPAARGFFDAEGNLLGDPSRHLPDLLARARRIRDLIVYGDVQQFVDALAAERETERRREEVAQRILAAGTRIPGVRARLYPYQLEGAAFLAAAGRGLLADDMGLGKTIQAIAATRVLLDRGELQRALIVCPASLKSQWASEIQRFTGLECQIVGGGVPQRLAQYERRATFTIANYELAVRDGQAIRELAPDLLILDEAQRIRNWRTKTAEAIKSIRSPFAFVLTGTPLQNRLDDLYSVMQVVDRRILGPLWAYNESFVVREQGGSRIAGYRNLDELRRRLRPHMLRRTKEEVRLQLPERVNSRIGVEITPAQRNFMEEALMAAARYASLAGRRPLTPEEEQRLFMAMQKARMACNAAGLIDKKTAGSPKLDEFEELIRDLCLERGRKVVVFSEWERFGRMAAQRAERLGIGFVRLHGSVPAARRGDLIERFRSDPECPIFFSIDAGGVGLNLQFASTLINLDLPWNPAVLEQRIGRLHRLGQKEPVHVLLLVADDSFESGLESTLRNKRTLFDAAMDRQSANDEVTAPSSCLTTVREALFELQPESESELGSEADSEVESDTCASASGESPSAEVAARKATELLGPRVRKVIAMPTGQLVALVDRVDEVVRDAAGRAGLVAIDERVEAMLDPLGASPFQGARTVLDRTAGMSPDPGSEAGAGTGEAVSAERAERQAVAHRKLAAARTLAAASLGAEAIEQACACMTEALRALVLGDDSPSAQTQGLPPARLLYEVLVPRGLLTLEQSALVSRAEGLSRAYAGAAQPVGAELVQTVLGDAERLLEQVARG